MSYTPAEMAAIEAYETYQRAVTAALSSAGRSTSTKTDLPAYPDIDALNRAVTKGYRMTLGKPTRIITDDWD
jgi:hypothetical protein